MDHDAGDVMGLGQSHMLPSFAGVGGFVNTISPGRTLAIVGFTGANPHDRGIGRRDSDIANRGSNLVVENRRPGCSAVSDFEYAAGCCAYIIYVGIALKHCEAVNAPTHRRRA